MEHASTPARTPTALDAAVLAAEARQAAGKATEAAEPAKAIDDAVGAFHDGIAGIFPCVFVLEHGRLWLVAQRGYAAVPDGLKVDRGIMGRAVRFARAQLAVDVHSIRTTFRDCRESGRSSRSHVASARRRRRAQH